MCIRDSRHWGHKVTEEMEAEEPEAAPQPEPPADTSGQPLAQPEPAAPAITPVQVRVSRPRASFDVDLGPDHTEVKEGGSEPIEPLIVGPGGTFGQNPLRPAPRPATQPIVQDAVETDASDFFAKAAQQMCIRDRILFHAKPVSPSMDSLTNRDIGYLPGVLT